MVLIIIFLNFLKYIGIIFVINIFIINEFNKLIVKVLIKGNRVVYDKIVFFIIGYISEMLKKVEC